MESIQTDFDEKKFHIFTVQSKTWLNSIPVNFKKTAFSCTEQTKNQQKKVFIINLILKICCWLPFGNQIIMHILLYSERENLISFFVTK